MGLHLVNTFNMPGMIFSLRYKAPYFFATYMAGYWGYAPSHLIAYTYDEDGVLVQAGAIYTINDGQGLSIVGFSEDNETIFCTSIIDGSSFLLAFTFDGSAFTLVDSIGVDIWFINDTSMTFPNKVVCCNNKYILPGEYTVTVFSWDGEHLAVLSTLGVDPGLYTTERYSDNRIMFTTYWGMYAVEAYQLSGDILSQVTTVNEAGALGQVQIINNIIFAFPADTDKVCAYTFVEDNFIKVDEIAVNCEGGLGFIKYIGNGYFIVCDTYSLDQHFDIVYFDFNSSEFTHIETVPLQIQTYAQGASIREGEVDFTSETTGISNTPIAFYSVYKRSILAFIRSDWDHEDTSTQALFYDSGESLVYLWNFGDGSTSSEENPTHAYSADGTYTVSLKVTDIWGSVTETKIGYITIESPGFTIDENDYFKRVQPVRTEELVNVIDVTVYPLSLSAYAEVYQSSRPESFSASETRTISIKYSEPPVKLALATLKEESLPGLIIVDAKYYAWGADITIFNSNGNTITSKISISGRVLVSSSEQIVTRTDDDSIREYGIRKYSLPKNHLIQSVAVAEAIADALLAVYATTRKDVTLDWRGNPAIELGDIVRVPEYRSPSLTVYGTFQVFKNQLNYDGGLRAGLEARRYYELE